MAKIISFLCWNLENFHNEPGRDSRVVDVIAAKKPDVFGIYEVKGAQAFSATATRCLATRSLSPKARAFRK